MLRAWTKNKALGKTKVLFFFVSKDIACDNGIEYYKEKEHQIIESDVLFYPIVLF